MPKLVGCQIKSMQGRFLWGCKENQHKISWISWDKVTRPKRQGGLGVKNITMFNIALLAKWHDLLKVCGSEIEDKWFEKLVMWKVREGTQARFWLDNWAGIKCLTIKYPRLFLNLKQKQDAIVDMGCWSEGSWVWQFRWHRN
uniref:Uncharacterized protein n=1 Tax=Cajanus cajan TaxID=3821 RepID=A0A151RC08_CAJCA|nr:hypothetical protein KK1_038743 [Cajanus cajan]